MAKHALEQQQECREHHRLHQVVSRVGLRVRGLSPDQAAELAVVHEQGRQHEQERDGPDRAEFAEELAVQVVRLDLPPRRDPPRARPGPAEREPLPQV